MLLFVGGGGRGGGDFNFTLELSLCLAMKTGNQLDGEVITCYPHRKAGRRGKFLGAGLIIHVRCCTAHTFHGPSVSTGDGACGLSAGYTSVAGPYV